MTPIATLDLENGTVERPNPAPLRAIRDERLVFSMDDLILDWIDGIWSTASFCMLALKFDRYGQDGVEDLDVQEFCDRWEGPENSAGKTKRLSPKDVEAALSKLEKAGRIEVTRSAVQLRLI